MINEVKNNEEGTTENKIILLVSIKGGVGKSLLCAHLATHLKELGIPVVVVDADIQQTLVRHRMRDLKKHPDAELPYVLQPLDTSDPEQVKVVMEQLKQVPAIVLVDCPGNINDPALRHIYAAADIAVIPTRYDADNLNATELFAGVFSKLSTAKMFFVPNCINSIEERREEIKEARDMAYSLLHKYGFITAMIKQGVSVLTNHDSPCISGSLCYDFPSQSQGQIPSCLSS